MKSAVPNWSPQSPERSGLGAVLAVRPQVLMACVLLLMAIVSWFYLSSQRQTVDSQKAELARLEQALHQAQSATAGPSSSEPDFTQRLPQRETIHQVVRFLGTLAQQHQVNLGQLSLNHTASSEQSLGRVDISLSMSGPYAGGKQVLSELLSRYPSLGVQSVSAVPRQSESGRIDWSVSMSLYVKD